MLNYKIRFTTLLLFIFWINNIKAGQSIDAADILLSDTLLSITTSEYKNILKWSDVQNMEGETYDIYYSLHPIISIYDSLLEFAGGGIPEGIQSFTHYLRTPGMDLTYTYYYALDVRDKSGNVSMLSSSEGVTNLAYGVAFISTSPPENFSADGDPIEWEWAHIKPFSMSVQKGTAFQPEDSKIDGDADLSAQIYLAIDENYLYVHFDVEDNIIVHRENLDPRHNDVPELFIGLYDWHGAPHSEYERGSEPDYHLIFTKSRVICSGGGADSDSLVIPGGNYIWGEKFPTGYLIEARIPLYDLAFKRNEGNINFDELFVPEFGMRIPVDIIINDNDSWSVTSTREGEMYYSPYNNGESDSTPARWSYTWIYRNLIIDQTKQEKLAYSYSLDQNYPNPFNPSTTIQYSVGHAGYVEIKIFDVLGREVKELVNQYQPPGDYNVVFDASKLASGVYIYHLRAGEYTNFRKMILSR